jgi:hypothetical protein
VKASLFPDFDTPKMAILQVADYQRHILFAPPFWVAQAIFNYK